MAKSSSVHSRELRQLLRPFLHRWYVLLIIPLVSAGIAYRSTQQDSVYYQAQVTLSVGPSVKEVAVDTPLMVNVRLVLSYSQIAMQDKFYELVARRANLSLSVDEIKQATVVQTNLYSVFFEIHVVDTNQERALALTQAMSDALTGESPDMVEMQQQAQRSFIAARRAELTTTIHDLTQRIADLTQQLGDRLNDPASLDDQNNPYVLRNQLESDQTELIRLNSFDTNANPNQIHLIESPHILTRKLGPQPKDAAIAMAGVSLALSIVLIILLDALADRVSDVQHVETIFGASVVLVVPAAKKRRFWRRSRPAPSYDPFAAELVAKYVQTQHFMIARVMIIHEKRTVQALPVVWALAEALYDLGINLSLVKGDEAIPVTRTYSRSYSPENGRKVVDGYKSSSPQTTSLVLPQFVANWEMISQQWPAHLLQIGALSENCAFVLIVCSLKNSSKKELIRSAQFCKTAQLDVAGIILA